jgi:hypothetical protein
MLAFLFCLLVQSDSSGAMSPTELLVSKEQPESNDCGVKCLSLYLRMMGYDFDSELIQKHCHLPEDSLTLEELRIASAYFGVTLEGVYANGDELSRLPMPSIALLEGDSTSGGIGHYVVVVKLDNDKVVVADPRYESLVTISRVAFQRLSSGRFLVSQSLESQKRTLGFCLALLATIAMVISAWRKVPARRQIFRVAKLLIVFASFAGCSEDRAPAKKYVAKRVLEVDQDEVVLGRLVTDQPQQIEFRVTNRSSVGLSIELAKSCGCLSARLEPPHSLAPNQSARVLVEIDPRGKFGAFTETIYLRPVEVGEQRELRIHGAVDAVWLEMNRLTLHTSAQSASEMELNGFVSARTTRRKLLSAELGLEGIVVDIDHLRERSIPSRQDGAPFVWTVPLVTKSDAWKSQLGTHRGFLTYELDGAVKRIDFFVYVLP